LLSPVFAILAMLIVYNLGKPVLFMQNRIGKNGKIFRVIKFKSMLNLNCSVDFVDDGSGTNPVTDQQRITRFGRWLRDSSLDEIPQLINILKGDMSFVGPRPWPAKYFNIYSQEQFRRHDVQPGVTGFAQINGRNSISWCDKINMDIWYIENRSFLLDVKIAIKTIPTIMNKDDIEIQEEFNGKN
jgi:lipopolysaccharide/colanic/teichoic acid biosynthesis glycosyltransferase